MVWRDLKAHHLAHQTFADTDALDRAIRHAIDDLNAERMLLPLANLPNLCLGAGRGRTAEAEGEGDDTAPPQVH